MHVVINNSVILKVIHFDLRKMFIASVQNNQQSIYLHHFHIIIFRVFFLCTSDLIPLFELQYNHVLINCMTLNYHNIAVITTYFI